MLTLQRLLVPVDFSGSSTAALHRALDLAERTGAEVHVLHVVPGAPAALDDEASTVPPEDRTFYQRAWARADGELTAYFRREHIGHDVRRVLSHGHPAEVVLGYAEAQEVDLIVMGTHGRRGVRRFLLGSVAEEVLRRADVPVLVVPENALGRTPLLHVLAPTDFSVASCLALSTATALADLYGAQLDLLHVVEPVAFLPLLTGVRTSYDLFPDLETQAQERLDALNDDSESIRRAGRHVAEGRAAEAVLDFVKQHGVDLVVMGKHGQGAVEHALVGSATERVARAAPCAVFAVPIDEDD